MAIDTACNNGHGRSATLIFGKDMMIVMADPDAEDLFGRRPDELVGTPVGVVLQQDSGLELYRLINRNNRERWTSRPRTIRLRLVAVHTAGKRIPVQVAVTEGNVLGHRIFMAVVRATRQRLTEKADRPLSRRSLAAP